MPGDTSMVDILVEAASGMSDYEVRQLIQLFERRLYKGDPVAPIITAIAGLSVPEMVALRERLTELLSTLPPPAGEPGGEAGVGAFPKRTPPSLSGGNAKEREV